jgi:hypothetical protein
MTIEMPPIRAITKSPKYHWFAYYDKLEFDPSMRYVLGMEVDFEHRSPKADDVIRVGMVDLYDDDRWIELGTTRAWCWQQGCMLQWRPGFETEVMWNDREGDQYVCHILDVKTGEKRTLPHPFYAVSPDGRTAVAPDFRRVNDMRPGYGYAGLPDPHDDVLAPEESGIYRLDLETGAQELIVSLADVARIPWPHGDFGAAKHYFNHLLFNTNGTRFEFLHRWRMEGQRGRRTRMLTAAPDGSDIRVVDDYGYTSHFIWRDPSHILAWAYRPSHEGAFYLFTDGSRKVEVVGKGVMTVDGQGVMTVDGHCTYLPGNEWVLNDAYPDADGYRQLYLYHVAMGEKVVLGRFYSPPAYTGEWRCDLHPRFSPDGRYVVIDSAHGGDGRQLYLIDISEVVAR